MALGCSHFNPMSTTPEICPVCGAEPPRGARACPECGACEETGWGEESYTTGLGLPEEEEFDYDEFIDREFGEGKKSAQRSGPAPIWRWVAGLLLILIGFWMLKGLW